jgi:hypothetical protein
MNVQIMTLCDAANADASGKLNILGAFDQIFATQAPMVHPSCTLAIKVQFERIEEGTKTFKIMVVDTDGNEVFPAVTGNIEIKMMPDLRTTSIQIVGTIQGLKLPQFGEYQIDLALDGIVVASVPLYARQLQQKT